MNVFGIGLPEMALIMVVALLIFGPKKLPEIGKSMEKAIRSFQDASKEFEDEFKREAEQIETAVKTTAEIEPKQITPAPSEAENIVQASSIQEPESQVITSEAN